MADNDNNLVFTVSSDLTPAQRGLKRFTNDIGAATDQIARKYQAAGTKIDASTSALQARIEKMAGISTRGAKEWTGALADQGKELERLRARYSPLFATINNYKSAVSDIRRAHAVGAISANEMTAAIQRERQAALQATAAIRDRNRALKDTPGGGRGGQGFQTANIAAQFQDIGVTAAMGMNPLQIALQQGTQLSAVLNTMGSGKQVISGLAAAFTSLISPVSLVTIGLIAGGAAAIQYFSALEWGAASQRRL
ncbi:phage tail length tape measure family protein [Ensifer canadensis]|uniref:phage tail length tape measure family protein n=1 Tax=Ensifer canadensis TaxID=555315 RepID=UPI0035E3D4DD